MGGIPASRFTVAPSPWNNGLEVVVAEEPIGSCRQVLTFGVMPLLVLATLTTIAISYRRAVARIASHRKAQQSSGSSTSGASAGTFCAGACGAGAGESGARTFCPSPGQARAVTAAAAWVTIASGIHFADNIGRPLSYWMAPFLYQGWGWCPMDSAPVFWALHAAIGCFGLHRLLHGSHKSYASLRASCWIIYFAAFMIWSGQLHYLFAPPSYFCLTCNLSIFGEGSAAILFHAVALHISYTRAASAGATTSPTASAGARGGNGSVDGNGDGDGDEESGDSSDSVTRQVEMAQYSASAVASQDTSEAARLLVQQRDSSSTQPQARRRLSASSAGGGAGVA